VTENRLMNTVTVSVNSLAQLWDKWPKCLSEKKAGLPMGQ